METKQKLEKIVAGIRDIPTLPVVILTLNKLLWDPKTDVADVVKVIARDPALSTKILKIANSAFYGLQSRVSTISRATLVLGFTTIYSIAVSATVLDLFYGEQSFEDHFFSLEEFWKHSIGVAVTTKLLCDSVAYQNPEEGWVAGLLHDIGKLILYQYSHHDFLKVLSKVKEKDILIVEAEKEVLGVTHSHIGTWISARWNLHPYLQEAIALHHTPNKAYSSVVLTSCVYAADILCRLKKIGSGGDERVPKLNENFIEKIGLDNKKLQMVISRMETDTEKAVELLNII